MLGDLWCLDLNLASLAWQQLHPEGGAQLLPRCSHAAAAVGGSILYFGGAIHSPSGGLQVGALLWRTKPARAFATAAAVAGVCGRLQAGHINAALPFHAASAPPGAAAGPAGSGRSWGTRCKRPLAPGLSLGLQVLDELLALDTRDMMWQRLQQPAGQQLPGARNGSTMVPAGPGSSTLVMHGGWKAFVESYDDTHLLQVATG
jgi:hypothetical protein